MKGNTSLDERETGGHAAGCAKDFGEGERPQDLTAWHEELLRRLRRKVSRDAIAYDAREDLVQQAMKVVLEKLPQVQPRNKTAWALTILDHLIIDYLRGRGRRDIEPLSPYDLDQRPAADPSPEQALLAAERRRIFLQAAACLKEPNKTYFDLLIKQELTNRQVTEQLGVSEATVRKQASRMTVKLAEGVSEIQRAKQKRGE